MSAFLLLAALAAVVAAAHSIDAESQVYMVPMRDGVKLHTIVTIPSFKSCEDHGCSAVMDRSPYGEDGTEMLASFFTIWGFVAIRQDMRGTHKSEGVFTEWHNAAHDAYDTSKWLNSLPWFDGKLFTVGISADGIAQFFQIQEPPIGLQAQAIGFATGYGYDMTFPGGAYRKSLVESWLHATVPLQADKIIAATKDEDHISDWWKPVNDTGDFGTVNWPSMLWAGWYDIFQDGNLKTWKGYANGGRLKGRSNLVVDPLGHCQMAFIYFPYHLLFGRALLPLFLAVDMFTGQKNLEKVKPATFYVMSAPVKTAVGNYWTTLDDFPTPSYKSFYLHSGGSLSEAVPTLSNAATSYHYDPNHPTPTIGGNNLFISCGPLDNTELDLRSDTVFWQSDVLTEPMAVVGKLTATLFVKTNATDTDFVVRLQDIHADGIEGALVQDGVIRMKWRDRYIDPKPKLLQPGRVYEVEVSLKNTAYVFSKGHRIRVSISSANFPRISANPNTGQPLNATNVVPVTALNSVFHSPEHPSFIRLPHVDMAQLPPADVFDLIPNNMLEKAQKHFGVESAQELDLMLSKMMFSGLPGQQD